MPIDVRVSLYFFPLKLNYSARRQPGRPPAAAANESTATGKIPAHAADTRAILRNLTKQTHKLERTQDRFFNVFLSTGIDFGFFKKRQRLPEQHCMFLKPIEHLHC